jgi:hypothetical protein
MARLRHELVLLDFHSYVRRSRKLASEARQWSTLGTSVLRPRFTSGHYHLFVELAFLRSFLAWERFLEEAFILYLIGRKPRRRRRAVRRLAIAKSHPHACKLLRLEAPSRPFVDWDNPSTVCERSKRWFSDGEPFVGALTARQNLLDEIRTLRNAIAHRSLNSQEKFFKLYRDKLGYLPANPTVGAYLDQLIAGVRPPTSYLDHYLDGLLSSAKQIVP